MIRFNCPHCQRRYEVLEALAHLAIICKGCGQPLVVPEKSTEPEPQPAPQIAPRPAPTPPPIPPVVGKPEPVPVPRPAPALASRPEPVAVAVESRLPPGEPSANGTHSTHPPTNGLFEKPDALAVLDRAVPPPSPAAPDTPAQSGGRRLIGRMADGVVALVLIVVGVFCGELLARQSTSDVLKDAATAAKFPPVDLLMWLAPPVLFLLVYALLMSRGRSLGSRLSSPGSE